MSEKPNDIVVRPQPPTTRASAFPMTVWQSDNFAEDWYRDALKEARSGSDHNARRRETIFTVCFAESYIFEWARRKLQIEEVDAYFPPTRRKRRDPRFRRNLLEKWKNVPLELYQARKIPHAPELDLSRLEELLKYRHGLIHASASRPATEVQRSETRPFPRKKDLLALSPGWAVSIVFDLVSALQDQLNEPKPRYLEEP